MLLVLSFSCGDADCPVASLLAMTCNNLPRVRIIPGHCRAKFATAHEFAWRRLLTNAGASPSSACHCEPVHGGPAKGTPLRGEEPQGSVALLWPLAGAGHGGLWGDEVWQSVSPAAVHNSMQHLRRIRNHLRIRPKCYLFFPFPAGMRIVPSLRSSQ